MKIQVLGTLQISEKSAGITQAAAVISVLTKVIEYQVPAAGYSVMLDADSVMMLKDNNTTAETLDSAQVQVVAVKADHFTTSVIEDTSYGLFKRAQDTRSQHHPIAAGDKVIIQPFGLLQVWVNSTNTSFLAAVQNFNLTAKKVLVSP